MDLVGIGCCAFMVGSVMQKAQFMPVPSIKQDSGGVGCARAYLASAIAFAHVTIEATKPPNHPDIIDMI